MDTLGEIIIVFSVLIVTFGYSIQASSPMDYYGSQIVLDKAILNQDQYINMYTLPKSRTIVAGTSGEIESSLMQINPTSKLRIILN